MTSPEGQVALLALAVRGQSNRVEKMMIFAVSSKNPKSGRWGGRWGEPGATMGRAQSGQLPLNLSTGAKRWGERGANVGRTQSGQLPLNLLLG